MKNKLNQIINFIKAHFKHFATAFFFIGFVVDAIYLPDYLSPWSRYLGAVYILIATVAIIAKNNPKFVSSFFIVKENVYKIKMFNFLLKVRNYLFNKLYFIFIKYKNIVGIIIDLTIAYAIGSTLSFVFIYYYRSVQVIAMWPILIGLVTLMCVNEFVKSATKRALIEISILILCIYLYCIYLFPFLFYTLSSYILSVSVAFALIVNMTIARILLYDRKIIDTKNKNNNIKEINNNIKSIDEIGVVDFKSEEEINNFGYKLLIVNICIPIIILILYMTDNLPAVPVTLKNVQVYNDIKREVVKNNSNYLYSLYNANCERTFSVVVDKNDYIARLKDLIWTKKIYTHCNSTQNADTMSVDTSTIGDSVAVGTSFATGTTSDRVTVYTAVYIPGYFYKSNGISHVWMHYSTTTSKWIETKRRTFAIVGGRDSGYRGFTYVDHPAIGDWKLRVINNDNRLIGEYKFKVE